MMVGCHLRGRDGYDGSWPFAEVIMIVDILAAVNGLTALSFDGGG